MFEIMLMTLLFIHVTKLDDLIRGFKHDSVLAIE